MIKQLLEGFALGAIASALGIKNILFWLFILLAVVLIGLTIFSLDQQGADMSVVYSILGYAGRLLLIFVMFFLARSLVRNVKVLIPAVLCIGIFCFMQVALGSSFSKAVTTFLAFVLPLLAVWFIDKSIMKLQKRRKLITKKSN